MNLLSSNYFKLLAIAISFMSIQKSTAQSIEQIKLKELQQIINSNSDKVKVINFWATWCAPCIKEMPLFEKINADHPDVEVTLVSMDYDLDPNPDKVNRFVSRKELKSKVLILAEQNPNGWIHRIDKNWNGVLPATLILSSKTGKRKLIQSALQEGDLEKYISEVIN
jgi:thiol-disulfide isomerase/thioredoxin